MIRTMAKCPQRKQAVSDPNIYFNEPKNVKAHDAGISQLLYFSHEVDVKPYKQTAARDVPTYRISKVVSPHMFYTEFDVPRPFQGPNWHDAMQEYYNNKKLSKNCKLKTVLYRFRCYVHQDQETMRWERVRVFKFDMSKKIAEVYFCDCSHFRVVSIDTLMELIPEFCLWAAQGFPTHLAHIRPVGGGSFWPKEAVEYFTKLVKGKSFRTVVTSRHGIQFPDGFPDVTEYLGVVMIQKNPSGETRTLQAEMVKAGFAEATGIFAGSPDMLRAEEVVSPKFSLEEFEKVDDSLLTVEGLNLEITRPTTEKIEKLMTEALERAETIRKSAMEMERQIIQNEFLAALSAKMNLTENKSGNHLPSVFQQRIAQIRFCNMASPGILYVQMENKVKELRELEAALNALVENQPPLPEDEDRAGIPVACLLQGDRTREPCWIRAVVRQALPAVKLLKVVLVDYGTEISVKYHYAKYLPKYFETIPSFAYRVHLASEGMVPSGGKRWSADSSDTFRKYLGCWNFELPWYYAWVPPNAHPVELMDFNQDLYWNPLDEQWHGSGVRPGQLNEVINAMSDHPLLRNAYVSFGIDVMFEVIVPKGLYYSFESLSSMLVEYGYAVRRPTNPTNRTIWDETYGFVKFTTNFHTLITQKQINNGSISLIDDDDNEVLDDYYYYEEKVD